MLADGRDAADDWPPVDLWPETRTGVAGEWRKVQRRANIPQKQVGLPGTSCSCNMQYSFTGAQQEEW